MKIHLIHAPLDMHRFHRWAGNRGLIRNGSFDAGYAFHVLLSAMFGKNMLQPFRLFASERRASAALYAYADVDEAELRGTADAVAPPDCLDVINPNKMRSKHMPSHFEKGRRLGLRPPTSAGASAAPRSGGLAAGPIVVQGSRGRRLPPGGDPTVSFRMGRFRCREGRRHEAVGLCRVAVRAIWQCRRSGTVQVGRCQSVQGSARQQWRPGGPGRDSTRNIRCRR